MSNAKQMGKPVNRLRMTARWKRTAKLGKWSKFTSRQNINNCRRTTKLVKKNKLSVST
jgi:hypothetical protein